MMIMLLIILMKVDDDGYDDDDDGDDDSSWWWWWKLMMMMMVMVTIMVNICDDDCYLEMKFILVKEVMTCDLSPVAMILSEVFPYALVSIF